MRKIICGEIVGNETFSGTPIECFKEAVRLSKQDGFTVLTNDAMFIEALEVLCGEENIDVYLFLNGVFKKVSFLYAYNYLGDVYDIIDKIRGRNIALHVEGEDFKSVDNSFIDKEITNYVEKYMGGENYE